MELNIKKISLLFCVIVFLVNSYVFAYETDPDVLSEMHKSFSSQYSYNKNVDSKSFKLYDVIYTCGIEYRGDGMQYCCPAIYVDNHAIMYDSYDFSKPRTKLIINGSENEYTYQNYLYNSRTLVPADVFCDFGCEVDFNESTYVCTISGNNTVLEILPNLMGMRKNKADGYYVPLDVCARFINDTLYVPVRAVADQLGLYIDWNGETNTVTLNSVKKGGLEVCSPRLFINEVPEEVSCSMFELSGAVWDNENKAEVYVNNELVVTAEVNQERDWNKKLILQPGENKIEISVKNSIGYEFTEIKTVRYSETTISADKAPVFAALECPQIVNSPTATISGYISNVVHGVQMTINGYNVGLIEVPDNMFNIALKGLIPGENTYKFVLTNNHGKSTEVVKTITYIEK